MAKSLCEMAKSFKREIKLYKLVIGDPRTPKPSKIIL